MRNNLDPKREEKSPWAVGENQFVGWCDITNIDLNTYKPKIPKINNLTVTQVWPHGLLFNTMMVNIIKIYILKNPNQTQIIIKNYGMLYWKIYNPWLKKKRGLKTCYMMT